jgi:membrane-bound serine protease (ClpP class)
MRRGTFTFVLGLTLALLVTAFAAESPAPDESPASAESPGPRESTGDKKAAKADVVVLEINGAIGPATSRYIERGIEAAQAGGSKLVVLKMDTPGGLDTSMRDIIRVILASPIPVASYVAPSGARAASAGTYIMYASHIAAMAPATNLGAATPVSIGGEPPPQPQAPGSDDEDEEQPDADSADKDSTAKDDTKTPAGRTDAAKDAQKTGPEKADDGKTSQDKPGSSPPTARERARKGRDSPSAMERKVINDAVAYIRGLAELRGRNVEWAEAAVRTAESLSATDALSMRVIDVIARDIPDLLRQIDGREVKVGNNTVKLATSGLTIETLEPDWRTRLLSVITNPTIAYGLLLIGIYGLLFEGYNPGAILPGVVGVIALITALFAFQILSVNYAGLALIGLGVVMIIAEFFVPSFGALGLGGLIAFVIGSIILLDTDTPGLNIGMPIIAGIATVGAGVVFGIVWMARRSMGTPVVTGAQAMIGATAEVFEDFTGRGVVRFGGELWNAISDAPVRKGQFVRIKRVEGLLLWVEPT